MEINEFLKKSIEGQLTTPQQEEFLKSKMALSATELKEIVDFLQKQTTEKLHFEDGIDVCGTGGSGLDRINTSTISAFILASLGVKVAKHGNRASSGRFGSFDLLESLGIEIENADAKALYNSQNLALLFAPKFHPVMRHFGEVRKKIEKPTFFNILGPILNPGDVQRQIIGTTFKDKMGLIAETCKLLGKERIYVVCGEDGLDEVTLSGKTFVTELSNGKISSYAISPKDFGIKSAQFKEIQGGTPKYNTKIALDILQGKCKSRHLDLVLINTALALKLAGKVINLKDGYKLSKEAITKGLPFEIFQSYKTLSHTPSILLEIIENKANEVRKRKGKLSLAKLKKEVKPAKRDFSSAIKGKDLSLIAEIKKSSPSSGNIIKDFSPSKIAKIYEDSGVNAISVLCDKKYFEGDLKYLKSVHSNTRSTPLLCKDFIIDEYQIYEARKYGTSAILLIASILTEDQIKKFIKIANKLKMAAICEVHTLNELGIVLNTPAKIIGINNRDLHTFKVDLDTTKKLASLIPKNKIIISESGVSSRTDIEKLPNNINAILVGTSIMKSKNIKAKINELLGRNKYLLKICGIRNVNEAVLCDKLGVDFIGLNFAPTSSRKTTTEKAKNICKKIQKAKKVGIFQNQKLDDINKIAKTLNLDYIQLSGNESVSYIKNCCKPVIKTVSLNKPQDLSKAKKYLPHVSHLIFDSKKPGSGKTFNPDLLKNFSGKFLVAGGINSQNICKIVKTTNPQGVDLASGVETNGKIDLKKIQLISNKLKSC